MAWNLGLSMRDGYVVQDITLTVELRRLVEALFWKVGMACRMLLQINASQSVICDFGVSHR